MAANAAVPAWLRFTIFAASNYREGASKESAGQNLVGDPVPDTCNFTCQMERKCDFAGGISFKVVPAER
jgi:hypothetical protein